MHICSQCNGFKDDENVAEHNDCKRIEEGQKGRYFIPRKEIFRMPLCEVTLVRLIRWKTRNFHRSFHRKGRRGGGIHSVRFHSTLRNSRYVRNLYIIISYIYEGFGRIS